MRLVSLSGLSDTVWTPYAVHHRVSDAARTQTARFLVKSLLAAEGGKAPAGSVEYVADARAALRERCAVRTAAGWLAPDAQVAALRCVLPRGLGVPHCSCGWGPLRDALPQACTHSLAGSAVHAHHLRAGAC